MFDAQIEKKLLGPVAWLKPMTFWLISSCLAITFLTGICNYLIDHFALIGR